MDSGWSPLDEAVRSTTLFQCVCPECGRVGAVSWCREYNVVKCRGCGARFDYTSHTYRPVTGGMTDEERDAYYRERARAYDSTPARLRAHRERARLYYRKHRAEVLAKKRERYREHRDEILARQRERRRSK